jgi:hypothetical protein
VRIYLKTVVEHDGAQFTFGEADRELIAAEAQMAPWRRMVLALVEDTGDAAQVEAVAGRTPMSPALIEALCELFLAALRDWSGVTDGDTGQEAACTKEAKGAVPTEVKVSLALAFLGQRGEVEAKRAGSATPPS